MKKDSIVVKCPVKSHIHTNPDGSTIEITSLDIDERSFWDEMIQDWVKSDKKKRHLSHKDIEIPKL